MNRIKCLNCKENAHELYLQSQHHIYLNDRNNFLTFIPKKNQKQVSKTGYKLKSPSIKVYYCENCNLVWFHLNDENE